MLISMLLMITSIAGAANVPSGLTGLWRFQNADDPGAATIGYDITFSSSYGAHFLGPWTDIGLDSWHTKFSDGDVFQEWSWSYMSVNPGFSPNGGGRYVNQYTIAIDYAETSAGVTNFNSLFQTSRNGNATDGDLWITWPLGTSYTDATIGVDDVGYSTLTFNASKWHRIVWSVDNGNFFRVYVDGTLFLDGAGQEVDGRFSLYPDRFNLFADNNWQDAWGMVGTVATWNRALTSEEVASLGGWIGTNASPTPLLFNDGPPQLMSVSLADGETNVSPDFNYQAIVLDLDGFVDTNSIQLLLDGAPVSPLSVKPAGSINIQLSAGGLLRSGSTHTYSLIMSASGAYSTNEVTFTVQNYTGYEWDFANADLSTALGNGVMSYADEFSTPGITSFGTTDGSTVPHINGIPANYMHVPAFTLDTDGYWLQFNDSGPNVGTNAYINRYTLLMDVMIPEPWVTTWIVPFFNTDPYNLNDADFYLKADGAIGIGYAGYSSPGVMTSNAWYRVGFVADLKASTLNYYVNGINVKSGSADGLGGRWALFSNQDVGPYPLYPANLFLFNEADPSGMWTHELYLSSVAFTDRALSDNEMAALGGPNANGILLESFTPAPTLTSHLSGSDVVISWPSNYVGYALEHKLDLGSSAWAPAPGVTNNSVTIPAGSGSQFFRLVQ